MEDAAGLPRNWLRAALRYSLSATVGPVSYPRSIDDDSTFRTRDFLPGDTDIKHNPKFRKLVMEVMFSRWFIWSYNMILAAVILGVALVHWTAIWRAKRARNSKLVLYGRSQDDGEGHPRRFCGDGISSSGSSTVEGNETPPDAAKKVDDEEAERMPLIGGRGAGKRKMSLFRRASCRLRSFLMYQPRPIPVVNKIMPSNGTTLVVLVLFGFNIFYLAYHVPTFEGWYLVLADRAGLVFVANLPLLYLFAAKNNPLRTLTGYSYESLNIFHRRLGEIMCAEALIHCICMFCVWYGVIQPMGYDLVWFLTNPLIVLGLCAFVSYEVIYFTSLGSFRQQWYELFLVLHIVLQVAGLLLLFFHHTGTRPYVVAATLIWTVDRIAWRVGMRMKEVRADVTILEDGETMLVSADWDIPMLKESRSLFKRPTIEHGWRPTDHVFLTVPELGKTHILQAHPFTIYSAAPASPDPSCPVPTHAWLSFLVRAQGGFSRELLHHARKHSSIDLLIDGPYGSTHSLDLLSTSDAAVIVAGGSGIAVAYPLLWALLAGPRRHPSVHLVWVVHAREHYSWLPEERLAELKRCGLRLHVEPPTREVGRPDLAVVVADIVEQEVTAGGLKAGVVVSGPDGMTRDVRNACAALVAHGRDVSIVVEKFGW